VLDIVATHENDAPAPADPRVIDHPEPRLQTAQRIARSAATEAARRPCRHAHQPEHNDEGEEELD
jgi:hypothetical protein